MDLDGGGAPAEASIYMFNRPDCSFYTWGPEHLGRQHFLSLCICLLPMHCSSPYLQCYSLTRPPYRHIRDQCPHRLPGRRPFATPGGHVSNVQRLGVPLAGQHRGQCQLRELSRVSVQPLTRIQPLRDTQPRLPRMNTNRKTSSQKDCLQIRVALTGSRPKSCGYAEYERRGMNMALAELEQELSAAVCQTWADEVMKLVRLFVNVTDLFGQVYIQKDLTARIQTMT